MSSRYQLLALVPATVALLCVIAAGYIVWQQWRDPTENGFRPFRSVAGLPPALLGAPQPQRTVPKGALTSLPTGGTPPEEREVEVGHRVVSTVPTLRVTGGTTLASAHGVPRRVESNSHGPSPPLKAPKPQERVPLTLDHKLVHTTRARKYTFQSEARDTTIYPDPAFYRVTFPTLLRNVIAIFLNLAVIPVSEYNINEFNQWIDIDEAGTIYQVQIPEGYYTEANIAMDVQNAIVATHPALAAYTVSFSTLTKRITIDSNGAPFSMLYRTGPNVNRSTWIVLGFPREDTTAAVSVTAPGTVDLLGALAIDLFAEELTNSLDGSLARIELNRQSIGGATYFTPSDIGAQSYFWPIGKLQFLTFRFMVPYTELLPDGEIIERYRLYQFNGRQHMLDFDVITREYRNVLEDNVELDPQM